LNLRTVTKYESDYNRRVSRLLPAGVATGATVAVAGTKYDYYGDVPQYGALKSATAPPSANGSSVVTQFVYDLFGRRIGSKRNW
jgi:hypothetical protein